MAEVQAVRTANACVLPDRRQVSSRNGRFPAKRDQDRTRAYPVEVDEGTPDQMCEVACQLLFALAMAFNTITTDSAIASPQAKMRPRSHP